MSLDFLCLLFRHADTCYSTNLPDLVLSVKFLFGNLKQRLQGTRLMDGSELQSAVDGSKKLEGTM